jgi:myo-inositol-1-phosphate synthase
MSLTIDGQSTPCNSPLLIIIAGAKGAVASTLAVATIAAKHSNDFVAPYLTTAENTSIFGSFGEVDVVGWDTSPRTLVESIRHHGVLPDAFWSNSSRELELLSIRTSPSGKGDLNRQVERLQADLEEWRSRYPRHFPVFVNLLPACAVVDLTRVSNFSELSAKIDAEQFPDIAYTLAAIRFGIPVANFTPNAVEIPYVIQEADHFGVPLAGRDGKTGQTFFKVVLASAFKSRRLRITGWYSLNILGNDDGVNLMDPVKAAGKIGNKTDLLEAILGYPVGIRSGESAHKVRIDYYPPRGDSKEAWDVIDFEGFCGMPMSLRLNLQGRDSILAAPLVWDLARWMATLKFAGYRGAVPELGFFFKKPVGDRPPQGWAEQLSAIKDLELACEKKIVEKMERT